MIGCIYLGTAGFVEKIYQHPGYDPVLPARLINICMLAFFFLLLFSSAVAALSHLYNAKDMQLLLTLPIRPWNLYCSRLFEIVFTSSWMFLLFALPALLGLYSALDLSPGFLFAAIGVLIPFLLIPATLAVIAVTIFVNVFPPHRIRDLLVLSAFALICIILFLTNDTSPHISTDEQKLNEFVYFLYTVDDPQPIWSPAKWAGEILNSYLFETARPTATFAFLLVSSAMGLTALGYLVFESYFYRGWGISIETRKHSRVYGTEFGATLGRLLIPFNSQLRAICYKEARMFIRDTTQSLQLLMLLMLTFVYLYNFRALRVGSGLGPETLAWWQVILSLANVAFGTCVISAIATRFVFPSISLEGAAYFVVRVSPVSIEGFLKNKFYTWLVPVATVCSILLVSGSWAINAAVPTVIATLFLAVMLSFGIVGLGIGVGAIYARFDWDSPAQVTANFGSLMYMLLALGTIVATLIPSGFLFVLTSVPTFTALMSKRDHMLALTCCYLLIFVLNYSVARHAMSAGAQRLKDMEK